MSKNFKTNILFLIPKNDVGGAPKFVREQIQICHESGFNCFLATNEKGWINDGLDLMIQKSVYDQRILKMASLAFLWNLISFMKKNRINLVVCNSANGGLYGRLAAFLLGRGSVYVSHGWSSVYNGGRMALILNLIEQILSWIGTRVLCISKGDEWKARKFIRVPESKLVQLNNAIFPVRLKNEPIKSPKFRILSVTRFRHPKRVDYLIEAIKNIPNVELYIVGDGEQKAKVENLIEQLELKNVYLLGEIPGFDQFSSYDLFALISESEGLPMSALEAMSAGLPLLLSDVGGCPELIHENGELCKNEVSDIQLKLQLCIQNVQIYSAASLKLFEERFNLEKRKAEFITLYAECFKP
jgi:glycosyltransferase involved in cell wall biosynthesis